MRRLIRLIVLIELALAGGGLPAQAQNLPYSSPPVLQAFQTTNLVLPYTAGLITAGGYQTFVNLGTVTLADNMISCQAPGYVACNFVYWAGGVALSTTTTPAVAFQAGNVLVGFVTTRGGSVATIVTFAQASSVSDNLLPTGVTPVNGSLRLPVCTAIRTILNGGCQASTGSLSGY